MIKWMKNVFEYKPSAKISELRFNKYNKRKSPAKLIFTISSALGRTNRQADIIITPRREQNADNAATISEIVLASRNSNIKLSIIYPKIETLISALCRHCKFLISAVKLSIG